MQHNVERLSTMDTNYQSIVVPAAVTNYFEYVTFPIIFFKDAVRYTGTLKRTQIKEGSFP